MLTGYPNTIDVRGRRERLGVSCSLLAARARVSRSWLQAIECGLQPVGSGAVQRVVAVLDQLEAEHEDDAA